MWQIVKLNCDKLYGEEFECETTIRYPPQKILKWNAFIYAKRMEYYRRFWKVVWFKLKETRRFSK
jgi:hypothetical protein